MQLENVADIYPLSPIQQGMLFHTLSAPRSGVYIEHYCCKIRGDLRISEFQAAWRQVIDRQPVLRTAFLWEGLDDPLQIVRQQVKAAWDIEDWRSHSPVQQEEKLVAILARSRAIGFDLRQAPIARFQLMRLQDDAYQFVWSFHHLLADGWSIPIIWQEVLTCYAANCRQEQPILPPLRPYRDYIAWLQTEQIASSEPFWRSQLQGFTEPTPLPAARPGSPLSTQSYRQQIRLLPPDLNTALKNLARQHRLTLNTLIQGAWALLLHHYSGQDEVTYGSVVSGRPTELKGVETMVGLFINTLPMRVAIELEQPLLSWLQTRQQQLLDLRQHQATPLTDVRHWSDLPAGSPLFESIVVFENYPAAATPDLSVEIHDIRYLEQSNYPLALLVVPRRVPQDSLELILLYDPARFEDTAMANGQSEIIARLHDHLELLLTAFVQQPQATLADIPRLTLAEQQQLAVWQSNSLHDGRKPCSNHCIHHLIEAQVAKTPTAPAVVFADKILTYSELNQQADRLANALRSRGVTPGDRVALCLPPCLDRIVSILAVLKTGSAYVPLDPTYPTARLEYCLQDTSPKLLITQRPVPLPHTNTPALYLDENPYLPHSPISPKFPASPNDLAYIIYTSGSTGQPKGVMVSHRNLAHSTTARSQIYPNPVDRFLLLSSIAFDSSVAGIFWTLCQGGTLVLPPERIEQDLQQLAELIAQQQITHTLCVPTLYGLLIDAADPQQLATLRTVIVAGEACSRTLAQQHSAKLPNTALYNEYGPTEATVWATAYRIPANLPPGPITIGHPIPNTQIHLLDQTLQPVPIGAIGELYISGDGVAQGYWNQPEKTAAAFVRWGGGRREERQKAEGGRQKQGARSQESESNSPPPSPHPTLTLYKTGDLGRYRSDGNLEWLGRCDRQVKIRGYRIELGEIEEVLRSQETVQEAVVVAQTMDQMIPQSAEVSAHRVESLVTALAALDTKQSEALLAAVEGGG